MINLSDFNKNIKVDLETGEKGKRFDGDFEFYTLNKERFETIRQGVDKLKSTSDDLEVTYTLLPYICSINVDEDLNKFNEMNDYSPCTEFTEFMISLTEYMKSLLKQVGKIEEMNLKVNTLLEENPILKEQMKLRQETTEEKILRVTKEMNNEKDTRKKRGILLQLAKLYEEVENNG